MLKAMWRRFLGGRIARSVEARLNIDARLASAGRGSETADVACRLTELENGFVRYVRSSMMKTWKRNLHVTSLTIHPKMGGPFMSYSTCSTTDFLNPEYEPLCRKLGIQPNFHRKDWESAFILHHALRTSAVGLGRRALGFAVGLEPLPPAFLPRVQTSQRPMRPTVSHAIQRNSI